MTEADAVSLLDLHVHTRAHSIDSAIDPDALARRALALGLSAVCITEHNAVWPLHDAEALAEAHGIPVIRGMEVDTNAGHVLVFGLEAHHAEMHDVERLREIIEREAGAMVLAHPCRPPGFRRPWTDAPALFEALEALNGDESSHATGRVLQVASELGMPVTGGSDAHALQAVGRNVTECTGTVTTEQHLIAALREGRVRPLDLSTEQSPL